MSSSDDIVDRLRAAWPKYPWADEAADEIERLRARVKRLVFVKQANLTPEDIGMVRVPIEDQATDRPLWGFPR